MRYFAMLTLAALLIAGCARTPPIVTTYYPSKSGLNVRLVRTLGCDKANLPVVATAVTATVSHIADATEPMELPFAGIDGAFANTDIKMDFYGDRRLKSINATTTGQGETIIKSAISLLGAVALEEGEEKTDIVEACKAFKTSFGDTTLTLIFVGEEDFATLGTSRVVEPDSQSARYAKMFKPLLGESCIRTGQKAAATAPVTIKSNSGYVMLHAKQPGFVPVSVTVGPVGTCEASPIWTAVVAAGQHGVRYSLPIPPAAAFGKQVFAASFDEAGAITSLQYAKESGAAGALNTIKAGLDEFTTTDAEQAAAYKAEADVIAAQQRLVKCQTTPTSC